MTAPALFKQADVTRLLKAAQNAGWAKEATKLTIAPDGSLSICNESLADNDDGSVNEWDNELCGGGYTPNM
jgi:hypothetical protein